MNWIQHNFFACAMFLHKWKCKKKKKKTSVVTCAKSNVSQLCFYLCKIACKECLGTIIYGNKNIHCTRSCTHGITRRLFPFVYKWIQAINQLFCFQTMLFLYQNTIDREITGQTRGDGGHMASLWPPIPFYRIYPFKHCLEGLIQIGPPAQQQKAILFPPSPHLVCLSTSKDVEEETRLPLAAASSHFKWLNSPQKWHLWLQFGSCQIWFAPNQDIR